MGRSRRRRARDRGLEHGGVAADGGGQARLVVASADERHRAEDLRLPGERVSQRRAGGGGRQARSRPEDDVHRHDIGTDEIILVHRPGGSRAADVRVDQHAVFVARRREAGVIREAPGDGPVIPRRRGIGGGGTLDDRQGLGEGVLGVDDGAIDAVDLLDLLARSVERRALADPVGDGADIPLQGDAVGARRPARTVQGRSEEHDDRMIGGLEITHHAGGARDAAGTGHDDFHPATSVGPDDRRGEVVLHGVQHAARFRLGREIGDRAVIDAEGVRRDGDDHEDDDHHDGGGHHDLEQREAGPEPASERFHRLMMKVWTSKGVSSRALKALERL